MSDVQNKLAVVTGGTSGIGKGIVKALAENGWNIAINALHANEETKEFVDSLQKYAGKFLFAACDVGSSKDVKDFYAQLQDQFQSAPDLLVNNAGTQTWAPLLELTEEDWDKVIRTNLKGCFLNTQIAAKLMVEQSIKGSIINIGSGCNKVAFPKLVDYAASKGGIEMFTKASAIELGEYGIRVNCVAPGGIMTERTVLESPSYEKDWESITPLGRVGKVEDIANVVLMLANENASFVSGQTLWVDGAAFSKANWPYR